MNTIVYVGMDVHKENYTLCCYCYDTDKVEYKTTVASDYKLILKYMERVCDRYEGDVKFVCGYEAGCLGYSLYNQLKEHGVDCKILAPTTMAITNTNRVKTDRRDAANIARCLAFHTYSEVYVPDNETLTEYLITYEYLEEKIQRLDARIEEFAQGEKYCEKVKNMSCFIGIKTHTAMSMLVEVGDFERFESASKFSAFLGLVPRE